jgi:hypothetical protein
MKLYKITCRRRNPSEGNLSGHRFIFSSRFARFEHNSEKLCIHEIYGKLRCGEG